MTQNRVIPILAETLLARGLATGTITEVCATVLGPHPRLIGRLARRLLKAFPEHTHPTRRRMETFLATDRPLRRFLDREDVPPLPAIRTETQMVPTSPRTETWKIPPLSTEGELAAWLGLTYARLLWLADPRGRERKVPAGPLRRYGRYWVARKNGNARLIESPRPLLKTIQRKILTQILDGIPLHHAAHGFCPGRSTATFAHPHTGKEMVLRMDLRDFFPSISRARVSAIFRTAGYPERVAALLAGLCTTATPPDTFTSHPGGPADWQLRKTLEIPHLPQGAPTSPALANLCAFRLDGRLAGLARAAGGDYTRYADDLTFSGGRDFARSIRRFEVTAGAIALEEGFSLNHRKTRAMGKSTSQRTAGLVVNAQVAIPRERFDRLKAILFNCVRSGPHPQNQNGHPDFQAHLAGHIAQVAATDPRRGEKLKRLWTQIRWERQAGETTEGTNEHG